MSDITATENIQLKLMLMGASQLSACLNRCASEAVSPQLKDELGKLAATCDSHKEQLASMLGGTDQ